MTRAVTGAMQRLKNEYCRNLPVFRETVETIGEMLTIDYGHRPSAIHVVGKLQALAQQAAVDLKQDPELYIRNSVETQPPVLRFIVHFAQIHLSSAERTLQFTRHL